MVDGLILLVGPGGAGKSTVGATLAQRVGMPFADLDECFMAAVGGISECIESQGYEVYAERNVEVYCELLRDADDGRVIALSSGFMTYPLDIHPAYAQVREEIVKSTTTFVLLPSLEFETCVAETVRRQMTRPFIRSSTREEAMTRERFGIYVNIPARKVETMRSVDEICDDLAVVVAAQLALASDARCARTSEAPIR
jgi:shikimate kinase